MGRCNMSFRRCVAMLATAVAALCGASACQADLAAQVPDPAHAVSAAGVSRGLILKLKGKEGACDGRQVRALASETGQSLDFLRPMSGGACVVVQHGASAESLDAGLRRLRQLDAVEWAEIDAVMTIQK